MADQQFDLAWDQVKVLAERRQNATTAYVSINTAVAAAMALMFKDGALAGWRQHWAVLLLLGTAIVTCYLWRQHVGQYREVLAWWYGRLRELNDPRAELIRSEYEELYQRHHRPLESHRFETTLTWVFTALYVIFALVIVLELVQLSRPKVTTTVFIRNHPRSSSSPKPATGGSRPAQKQEKPAQSPATAGQPSSPR